MSKVKKIVLVFVGSEVGIGIVGILVYSQLSTRNNVAAIIIGLCLMEVILISSLISQVIIANGKQPKRETTKD